MTKTVKRGLLVSGFLGTERGGHSVAWWVSESVSHTLPLVLREDLSHPIWDLLHCFQSASGISQLLILPRVSFNQKRVKNP